MITSISKKSGIWSDALRNSTFQCKRMLNDMKLEEGLPEERLRMIMGAFFDIRICRYIRVRYEDLVDKTTETVVALYQHLKLGLSQQIKNVVYAHTHAENIKGTNR